MVFTSHQEPGTTRKSDLRARLAMSNGRLQLEPSDAGSCFRVGNTKRWISDVDGGVGHWTGHGLTGFGACAWCTAWRHQSIPQYAINFGRGLTRCLENTSSVFEGQRRGPRTRGERAHGAALSAYRSQHKTGGEVARTEAPVDGVVPTLPVDEASDEADMIRRKDEWRRDVSHPNLGTASLRGMSKTPTALSPARDSF